MKATPIREEPNDQLRRQAPALCFTLASTGLSEARIADNPVRIVVMTDQSSAYSDNVGKGSVVAAQLAIDDVGGKACRPTGALAVPAASIIRPRAAGNCPFVKAAQ